MYGVLVLKRVEWLTAAEMAGKFQNHKSLVNMVLHIGNLDLLGPENIAIALYSSYHDQYVDVVLTDKMAREFIAFIEQAKAATS